MDVILVVLIRDLPQNQIIFLTETELDLLWIYLPPPQLYVVLISINFFLPPHSVNLCQSTSRCLLFPPIISLRYFLLGWPLFLLLHNILLQLTSQLPQSLNVSKDIIPSVYSSDLLWSLYVIHVPGNDTKYTSLFWNFSAEIDFQDSETHFLVTNFFWLPSDNLRLIISSLTVYFTGPQDTFPWGWYTLFSYTIPITSWNHL